MKWVWAVSEMDFGVMVRLYDRSNLLPPRHIGSLFGWQKLYSLNYSRHSSLVLVHCYMITLPVGWLNMQCVVSILTHLWLPILLIPYLFSVRELGKGAGETQGQFFCYLSYQLTIKITIQYMWPQVKPGQGKEQCFIAGMTVTQTLKSVSVTMNLCLLSPTLVPSSKLKKPLGLAKSKCSD